VIIRVEGQVVEIHDDQRRGATGAPPPLTVPATPIGTARGR
jgi:hypothetical protein